ncbi:hypothetical protein PHYBLDRAFT_147539 [Phycomyces blakesleeanus NRRL 1555(-)]|uniref:Uncharacterized protein n=1 Tax=Phycomyces blakesleeanus (strain ATCC 8743b / DSM 1359 / FGSC 10004 / NBRC 33097 / NRRL 1555) TaxID=763407 RepID=A0A167M4L4_PHYB8|nr:hypothetical protein PHYBLDRAFT_147539 [Phycomyces blakesleeanus NRRL 1555(-)]OAD71777.1 hypothetical protein PHYBLDRAFT_147539 [Phycomyces blakesleeanus NRRL 1555(-)]|eukprot:XP_018289817.1 hypothetical protein PHYBLDRAFT_147539 [Phycomyces blakesleeanus NRRL 1555(-)]
MANNHQSITPAPFPEYAEFLRRLTAIEESLKTMDCNIDIVIKGNKDPLEILDNIANAFGELLAVIAPTTISASASVPFAASSIGSTLDWHTTPSETFLASLLLLLLSVQWFLLVQTLVKLTLIRGELKKHNFKSNKLELVAANDSKHSWDVNVDYRLLPNRQLMHDLHAYLAPKHFDHRKLTYYTFKTEIDVKVGKSCDRLLQKEAMSEDESENNMSGVLSNCYNHFLVVVDDFMHNCMDFNSHQILKRSFGRDAILAVPSRLTSLLSHWTFRDEFQ